MKIYRIPSRKKFYLSLIPVFKKLLFITAAAAIAVVIVSALALRSSVGTFAAVGVAPNASTGASQLITIQSSGAGTANGDYVSDGNALDTAYRFFVEVPPGLDRLSIEIFDADIGAGGATEDTAGRDRDRGGYNSSVNYTLRDPSGAVRPARFTTGDTTLPASADNAWLLFFGASTNTVRDNFSTVAYSNNDGTANWAGNWVETDSGGGGATGGSIRVTGGELRLQDTTTSTPNIYREADLLGTPGLDLASATFGFDYRTSNTLDQSDTILVQVSGSGGGSWTTLETFSNDSSGSREYDISAFIANNTRIRFVVEGLTSADEFFYVDNVRITDANGGAAIPSGHWELRVDMSSAVTTGDDINAFGLRAHDGTAGAGGTELNVYADSFVSVGANPPNSGTVSRSYDLYPYITSGCACAKNDFDYDSNSGAVGSMALTSRTGAFTQNYASAALSANNVWRRDSFSGWTSDARSNDYGIWSADVSISSYLVGGTPNGNYANLYFSNFQAAANPPASNPASNAFRIYLPTDAGAAPVKPYLEQDFIYFGGANPPAVGQSTRLKVVVRVVNPTAQPITFSAPSNIVTANVPGGAAIYGGNAQVGQGSILSQPAVGGSGNITWNPGTIQPGATTVMIYEVRVTPTSAGQRVLLTATPASGNGTRASFVDETGNAAQARAIYAFGPLCELAVTVGSFAQTYNCGVQLVSPATLPSATTGQPYTQTFNTNVELYSGTLPGGLSVSGNKISGTPNQTGTFTFVIGTLFNLGASPSGCGSSITYTMTVNAPPTAAGVEVSGRVVTPDGKAISNVRIVMTDALGVPRETRTNPFGYFRLANVRAGATYIFSASHKNFVFASPQVVNVNDSVTNLNFTAQE